MTLDSAGTLPSGPASSDMHAVSHPDPVHGARPGINETETYATGSQDSNATNSTDPSITKPASNYAALNGASLPAPETQAPDLRPSQFQGSHLDHLSAIAAAQDKMMTDQGREHGDQALLTGGLAGGASKRTADGELKQPRGSMSPVKGHSRNTSTMSAVSTVSMASTTTSTIGDLSSDLKTRLSYAMLKVQNGWQSNSLDEVESMASQAASPTSSTSTIHRHKDASASPRVNLPSTAVQYPQPPSQDESRNRTKTNSPPARASSNGRGLAPPAPIRPSAGHVPNKRRHSNARNPPKLNTLGYAGSPHTPAQPSPLLASHMRQPDRPNLSPHQNVREQDAIETLLFMSSPGNSANMKHAFSPSGSPGPVFPNQGNAVTRHALPSGPRKALPMQRPGHGEKKIGFVNSPLTSQPQSPMDLDSPYASPNQAAGASRRRVNGASSHLRGALSLPSGLGASSLGSPRRTIDDAYVENMLERAAAESSDEDEIQLPPRRPAETLA